MKRTIFILFINLWLLQSVFGQDLKITIHASPNPATLQTQINLQISVTGKSQSLPDIPLPDLKNFTILAGPSTSTSIQIINFNTSAVKTVSFQLLPKRTGTFQIGPIKIKYKGKMYQSNSIKIVVKKGRIQSSPSATKNVFLKADFPDKEVYVYQPLPVTYKLYIRGRVRENSLQLLEAPDYVGFWVEDVKKGLNPYLEMVGAQKYTVYPIEQKILFPLKSGSLTIKPMRVSVDLLIKSKRTTDPFGFFDDFDDFFGNYSVRKEIASTEEKNIVIKPLPPIDSPIEPLVGKFSLKLNQNKFMGKTSDALTLRITVSGNGYLGALNELPLSFPEGFEVYKPKITHKTSFDGNKYFSQKTFEYILIPQIEGTFSTKEIKIPMFNYNTHKYEWMTIPSMQFTIQKGEETSFAYGGEQGTAKTIIEDIRYIKTYYTKFYHPGAINTIPLWAIVLIILNIMFFVILLYYQKILYKTDSDLSFARSRKARKIALKRLKKAKSLLESNQLESFSEEIYKAITLFISDRLHLDNKSLTIQEVEETLQNIAIPEEVKNRLMNLLSRTEYVRFSPIKDIGQEMQNMYNEASTILVELQKYI